jgi:hypothetical protein
MTGDPKYRFVIWHSALHVAEIIDHGQGEVAMTPGTITPFAVGNPNLQLLGEIPLACADPDLDMVALARRGLQALLDERIAEVEFARRYATVDLATRSPTPEAKEAKEVALDAWAVAHDRLARFNALHPERAAA